MIPLVLVILLIAGYFVYPDWYKRQVRKVQGVYYVYQGDKAYERSKMKDANVGYELRTAVKFYNIGLKDYPEHYQARCNLANIYVTFEDYSSAVEQYRIALKQNPDYLECRMNLGILQAEDLRDYDEAIHQYNRVASTNLPWWKQIKIPFIFNNKDSIKENKMNAYYNMGLAYRGKTFFVPTEKLKYNRYMKDAIRSYSKADDAYNRDFKKNKEINNYDTLYNLALSHHLIGEKKDAGLNYCRAIEADPTKYEAHLNLGILLDSMKYHKEAIDEYTKAGLLVDDGDYQTLIYLNDLLNDSYRRQAIQAEQQALLRQRIQDAEDEQKKGNWFTRLFEKKKELDTSKNSDKSKEVDKVDQNVIFKDGKAKIKEETEASFKKRIKACESKRLFEEMP